MSDAWATGNSVCVCPTRLSTLPGPTYIVIISDQEDITRRHSGPHIFIGDWLSLYTNYTDYVQIHTDIGKHYVYLVFFSFRPLPTWCVGPSHHEESRDQFHYFCDHIHLQKMYSSERQSNNNWCFRIVSLWNSSFIGPDDHWTEKSNTQVY